MSPIPTDKRTDEKEEEESNETTNEVADESDPNSQSPEAEQESKEVSASESPSGSRSTSEVPSATQWQAVWSPEYNAYYFFNPTTQETTWVNPLQPEASTSATASISTAEAAVESSSAGASSSGGYQQPAMSAQAAHKAALEAAAIAQGIDPALAHLDPSLLTVAMPGASASAGIPMTYFVICLNLN